MVKMLCQKLGNNSLFEGGRRGKDEGEGEGRKMREKERRNKEKQVIYRHLFCICSEKKGFFI